jgi:hypothetical protein
LKEFGFVRLFRIVVKNGGGEYWVTNKTDMTKEERQEWERQGVKIENYHRGLKQCCACEMAESFTRVERCLCRSKVKQHVHILQSLRAFVRLEANRMATGISWYEAKLDIVRDAIRHYLVVPTIEIRATA